MDSIAFKKIRQKNKTRNLDIYTIADLPDGYELFEITHANYSGFISMDTNKKASINNPSFSLITFVGI